MSVELSEVTKAVAEFDRVSAGLGELQKVYGGVIYDVTTTDGMDSAKTARLAIREPRYAVEKIRKEAKAPILALGKKLDSEAARITDELLKLENPIDVTIKAEESRREAEKQARIDAELKRVADLQERLAELRGNPTLTVSSGSALISDHIADLTRIVIDDSFSELRQQASDAKAAGLFRLNELHTAALAHEAEQVRIKAEREELARLRAAQEKRDAADRARIAEDERVAKDARDAEAARNAEANRLEREQLAKQREAIAKQEREQRERQAAEDRRLADDRAKLEREQAALRAAQAPPPVAGRGSGSRGRKAPAAAEIVKVLADHYQVTGTVAEKWLAGIRWSTEAA